MGGGMNKAPWVKFFPSDFLNGIADLDGEAIGCYTVILALIWDRGQPIEDDGQWIARRCGVSTRAWNNRIKPKLIATGKIEVREGLIGNRRAIEEIEKRDQISDVRRAAALARWHGEDQPELPLSSDYLENNGGYSEDKNDLISRKKQQKPQKQAESDDAHAFSTRARARTRGQRPESKRSNVESRPAREARKQQKEANVKYDDQSFDMIFGAICQAAGHSPPDDMIDRSREFVRRWRDAGISVDDVILPTIQRLMAETDDPITSSLKRFDRDIVGANAQSSARSANARRSAKTLPKFNIEGEDERMITIRKDIAKTIGDVAYCRFAQPTSFRIDEDVIRLEGIWANGLKDECGIGRLRKIAEAHGFRDIW